MPWTLGRTPDAYELPSLALWAADAPWLADAAVTALSLERELVSSVIPGNIRTSNGLSVGTASVTVGIPGDRATPWAASPARRVDTNRAGRLLARDDAGNTLDLGAWVTEDLGGTLSGGEVTVELTEAQIAAKAIRQQLPAYDHTPFTPTMPLDPIWVVSRLAEQAGYPAAPKMVDDAVVAVAMDGGVHATSTDSTPAYTVVGDISGWEVLPDDPIIGASNGSGISMICNRTTTVVLPISDQLQAGAAMRFTLNVVGTVYLVDVAQGWLIQLVNDGTTRTISTSNNLGTPGATRTIRAPFPSAKWQRRLQVEISRVWEPSTGRWLLLAARARPDDTGSWSDASISTDAHTPASTDLEIIQVVGGVAIPGTGIPSTPAAGRFAAVQLTPASEDTGLFAERRALLKPLGGDAGLPYIAPEADVWSSIRDALSARSAAAVIDPDGAGGSTLRVLARDDLAGAGIPGTPVDVGAEWADLPWKLDPADTADRIVVTYASPTTTIADIGSNTLAPAAWEASEVIRVDAGATKVLPVQFEGRAAVRCLTDFITPTAPSSLWSTRSTAIAFANPDGTGSPLDSTSFSVTAVQTSATTATITIVNRTSAPLYLVDGTGTPGLILRAFLVATFDTPLTVERGVSAEDSTRPLELDLTGWVQSKTDAQTVADYLWARVGGSGLWSVSGVACRLDWSHAPGRVLRAQHAATGLDLKVLITKVSLSATAGEITQTLDLALLPWTWADFDDTWATSTWAGLDTALAGSTWADFDTDPLQTGA